MKQRNNKCAERENKKVKGKTKKYQPISHPSSSRPETVECNPISIQTELMNSNGIPLTTMVELFRFDFHLRFILHSQLVLEFVFDGLLDVMYGLLDILNFLTSGVLHRRRSMSQALLCLCCCMSHCFRCLIHRMSHIFRHACTV